MYKKNLAKLKGSNRKNQAIAGGVAIAIIVLVVLLITNLTQPTRSVTAYCTVFGQEKTRLSAMSNNSDSYPSGVFNVSVNDAGQIATSFSKLDRVAPTEIEPDVSNLQKLYQDIHNNPSHAVSDSLNGGAIDDSLKTWTQQHCNN
jgi:hypothetical protein